MKYRLLLCALIVSLYTSAQNPLSLYDAQWDDVKYNTCNTAKDDLYMTQRERDVIWVLNCMRTSPNLFRNTVIKQYDFPKRWKTVRNTIEYKNLIPYMQTVQPLGLIYPDAIAYNSALVHAFASYNKFGHDRVTKEDIQGMSYLCEVISYDSYEAVDIIMDFLIDIGNPKYGHRLAITSPNYTQAGVSIQKHNLGYYICVINFK
jgi:hypothetical protein